MPSSRTVLAAMSLAGALCAADLPGGLFFEQWIEGSYAGRIGNATVELQPHGIEYVFPGGGVTMRTGSGVWNWQVAEPMSAQAHVFDVRGVFRWRRASWRGRCIRASM